MAYHEAEQVVYEAQSLRNSNEDPVQRADGDDDSVCVGVFRVWNEGSGASKFWEALAGLWQGFGAF